MRLRNNFNAKVTKGKNIYTMLCSTSTGTGLGVATYKVGQCCLDRASTNWFICTAIAGTGTWVALNA